MSLLGVFARSFIVGGLVCLPLLIVFGVFLGINAEVALLLAVALSLLGLIGVPELVKHLRRAE